MEKLRSLMLKHIITITSVFVPFSMSRNAKPKGKSEKPWLSLNWLVSLHCSGRVVLTTDYAMGVAHCEAYKASIKRLGSRDCILRDAAIRLEIESGRKWNGEFVRGEKHEPNPLDVVQALVLDAEVLQYRGFEEWADCVGFNSDSRRDEAIYRACLDNALALQAGLGVPLLEALREAARDE